VPKAKLLRSFVDRLQPAEKPYSVVDVLQSNFQVRVQPSGVKTYLIRYRPKGGGRSVNPRTLIIGRHPTLTPEQARDIAREKLALVAAGRDPAARDRSRVPMSEVLDRYLLRLEGTSSLATAASNIRLHLRPTLGGLLASEVTAEKVEDAIRPLQLAGKEQTAARSLRILRAAMRQARLDPAAAVAVKGVGWRQRRRVATPEELRRFFTGCRQVLEEERHSAYAVWLFYLLLLTGARPSEWQSAKWSDIDQARGLLIRERHKTVKKTGRPREIALSLAAREVLAGIPRLTGNPYILPGSRRGDHLKDYKKAWARIMEVAGIKGLWVYDLRRAIPAFALGMGYGLRQIGDILGHTHEATTAGYTWMLPSDRAETVERVSEQLRQLAGSALPAILPARPGDTSDGDPPE
jgi:integrase